MAQPREWVEAPPVTPLPFGLFSAAVVVDDLTGHAQMGTQYEPVACGDVHETRAACQEEAAAFSLEDDGHTGIPLVYGDPFTLFSMFTCNVVGVGPDRLRSLAGESLRTGESRGAERALADRLPLAAGAVDLTNGGDAVHVIEGLAALEEWAAANYGGVPTIHVPRGIGTLMGSLGGHQRVGNHLETRQGALVASGGGYSNLSGPPTDAEDPENTIQSPQTGEAWIYVTGTVVLRRAPQPDATPVIMSRVTDGDSLAATNDGTVLASRAYVASWECITAAVKVSRAFSGPVVG